MRADRFTLTRGSTTCSFARYSSPATATLGRLLLPYLFPELSAFATVEDLVSHLRTSDARYRATVPAEFLDRNQPAMFITLYFIVTCLPDSLCSIRDHFLSLDPTSLTVDLLEQHLIASETSAVATSLLLRTSGLLLLVRSTAAARARVAGVVEVAAVVVEVAAGEVVGAAVEVVEGVEVVAAVGLVAGVGALVAAMEAVVGVAAVEAVGLVAVGLDLGVEALVVASGSSSSVRARPSRPSTSTCGKLHTLHCCFSRLDDAWRAEFGYEVERPRWADLLRSGVAIFDLDHDAILSAMYALSASAEIDYYRCVPPDPGIAAAALGASASGTLPGTVPAEALHTFTLDSGASHCFFRDSTTLTPIPAPVLVRLADPSRGPVVAHSSTVLPCPAVLSGSLSGLHLSSFSTNLVSTAALRDAMVTTTTPGGHRVSICTCTRTGRHLATFARRPGSSLYTLATEPPQVAASAQVSASGQVASSNSCRLLSHHTLLWHHCLGLPSLPCLRGMHSRLLVSCLPRSLPPLPPSPAPPCLPCVEGRQRAAPHSSSFPPTTASQQTLHMDVWGPARYLPVLRLHFDRGGEFSSDLLWDFCRGEGITQSFSLPDSPQQNGIDERRIGLLMEVARTSMIHAAAPHFLWPFAVRRFPFTVSSPTALPLPLFLAPGPPPVDPLPLQDPAPSGVFQVDPLPGTVPVEVAVGSGAARGAASRGAASRGAEPRGAESEGAGSEGAEPGGEEPEGAEPAGVEPRGAEPEGVELGGAESEGAESVGAEPRGAGSSGGPASALPQLSPQQLREWLVRHAPLWSGATGAVGAGEARAGGAGVTAGAGGTGGTAAVGLEVLVPEVLDLPGLELETLQSMELLELEALCAGGAGDGGAEAGGAGGGGTGAGGAGAAGAGGAGGTVRPRPYFVPLLQQILGVPSSTSLTPPLLCPLPDQSPPLLSASPLPAPSPYTEQSGGLTERREPASRLVLPVRTAGRVPRSRPPLVPGTHDMSLRPSSVPLRVPLPAPPESSLPEVPRFASLLLAPEGDPDAPHIPTPRSYAKAITSPYSSLW
ncbi:unnamed protein product [Closterium sp. NIES-53]